MVRIKASVARKKGRKRLFRTTKGYYAQKRNRYVQAIKAAIRAMRFSAKHRRARARDFRSLWIARINAACRENGIIYSRFMRGLKEVKVGLDRKMLAEIAINDPKVFAQIVKLADKALPANITRMK
jgi:large subunit ribosomal protein L20